MDRAKHNSSLILLFLFALCLAMLLPTCNSDDEGEGTGKSAGEDSAYPWGAGCDADAAQTCATYYSCTGIEIADCAQTICDLADDNARACIFEVTDCADIRDCLPLQDDQHLFDGNTNDVQVLVNGNFDLGPGPAWQEISNSGYALIISQNDDNLPSTDAHTPDYVVWLGGYSNADDALYQTVTIPDEAVAGSVSCYVWIATEEDPTALPNDELVVKLRTTDGATLRTLATFSNQNPMATWTKHTWLVSGIAEFAGQSVQLYIGGTTNGGGNKNTNFLVDTCSFDVSE